MAASESHRIYSKSSTQSFCMRFLHVSSGPVGSRFDCTMAVLIAHSNGQSLPSFATSRDLADLKISPSSASLDIGYINRLCRCCSLCAGLVFRVFSVVLSENRFALKIYGQAANLRCPRFWSGRCWKAGIGTQFFENV